MLPPRPEYFRVFALFRATIQLGEVLERHIGAGGLPAVRPLTVEALEASGCTLDERTIADELGAPPLPPARIRPARRRSAA